MIEIVDKGKEFKKGRFFWHIKAKNGRILCHSETYNSLASARKGFKSCVININKIKGGI